MVCIYIYIQQGVNYTNYIYIYCYDLYIVCIEIYIHIHTYIYNIYYIYYVWESGVIIRGFKKWDQRDTITDNR
jgi:hypothetical protein